MSIQEATFLKNNTTYYQAMLMAVVFKPVSGNVNAEMAEQKHDC